MVKINEKLKINISVSLKELQESEDHLITIPACKKHRSLPEEEWNKIRLNCKGCIKEDKDGFLKCWSIICKAWDAYEKEEKKLKKKIKKK